jgi:hypothetical protein
MDIFTGMLAMAIALIAAALFVVMIWAGSRVH